jgi:hypothetical protein
MGTLHAFTQGDVVVAFEMGITRYIGVVVLYDTDLPVETIGFEPVGEFHKRHVDEFSFFSMEFPWL